MRRDVNFLKNHGLIDYSLLLAFEISTKKFKPYKEVQRRKESVFLTTKQANKL